MLKWTFCFSFLERDFLNKLSEASVPVSGPDIVKTLYAYRDSSLYYVIKIFPVSFEFYSYRVLSLGR